jgi:5'(3')-deoxyribonucleotidase
MSKKILLDLDGVIVDCVQGVIQHHGLEIVEWKTPGQYDMREGLGIKKDFWKGIDFDFWANLKPTKDAYEIMSLIRNNFNENDIGIMTLLPLKWGMPHNQLSDCILGKIKWLDKYFPNLIDNFFIGSTKHFIAHKDIILLDDSDKNINDFELEGGIGIFCPRAWNSKYEYRNNTVEYVENQLKVYL